MKILVIDTTTENLFVAVTIENEVFSGSVMKAKTKHSELLCSAVEKALEKANVDFCDLDAYAVATGPGSFTGIRIGISTVLGYNLAEPHKLIKIDNLDFLQFVYNLPSVIDAGNGWYFRGEDKVARVVSYESAEANNTAKFDAEFDYTEKLCEYATALFEKGEFAEVLEPLYIRRSQAEENLEKSK